MKIRLVLCVLGTMIFGLNNANAYNPPLEKGKQIFSLRCAACHNVNKQLTGPALAGVAERRQLTWIVDFIRSSQKLVRNGDKDAVALFEQFNKIPMPDHTDLSDEDIHSIVEFIKAESKPQNAEKLSVKLPTKKTANYRPLSLENDYGFFLGYILLTVVLILVLRFAVQVKDYGRVSRND